MTGVEHYAWPNAIFLIPILVHLRALKLPVLLFVFSDEL
jgi:hypothetical protein